MTETTTVEFSTKKLSDIPHVGQRKRVRVNGHPETLYVREVRSRVRGYYDDAGLYRRELEGQYTLVPFVDL